MKDVTSIILENEGLIYSIANKFSKYKNKEDLFQVGCIGVLEAYKNYDSSKNTKFSTYAYQYIFGQMNKYVREDHTIKLSRDMAKIKNRIEKAKTCLAQKLMYTPSIKELSNYLEIDEKIIEQVLNYNDPYSMDEINNEDFSMHEIIADQKVDYDTLIEIRNEIENLNEPEKTIMLERYFEDLTQTEIAQKLGISQVDVSRKEKKVLTKLRKKLN